MTTARFAEQLAAVLVPIGFVGAALAAICAIVAAVAIIRGAGGLCGGAVGVWIPSAMVSSTAGFASQWLPLMLAGGMLVAMLVLGAVLRRPIRARLERAAAAAAEVTAESPAESSTLTRPVATRPALASQR